MGLFNFLKKDDAKQSSSQSAQSSQSSQSSQSPVTPSFGDLPPLDTPPAQSSSVPAQSPPPDSGLSGGSSDIPVPSSSGLPPIGDLSSSPQPNPPSSPLPPPQVPSGSPVQNQPSGAFPPMPSLTNPESSSSPLPPPSSPDTPPPQQHPSFLSAPSQQPVGKDDLPDPVLPDSNEDFSLPDPHPLPDDPYADLDDAQPQSVASVPSFSFDESSSVQSPSSSSFADEPDSQQFSADPFPAQSSVPVEQSSFSEDDFAQSAVPQTPSQQPVGEVSSASLEPIERHIVVRKDVATDIYVEKESYKGVLLSLDGVQKGVHAASDHLSKVVAMEASVTDKITHWHDVLNEVQDKLIGVDMKLFEKGDDA